jgi:DNA-3-methyladenine glycosylase I
MPRCPWCLGDPLSIEYHDREWGVPVTDDARQFEFLVLESAQAGLSWLTVLRKRENYRRSYAGFDPIRVSRFTPRTVDRLLGDPGIIRNRQKIEASINNARRFLEVQREFGSFSRYLWSFVGLRPVANNRRSLGQIPAQTELSRRISTDLIKRGFRFVGPTIIYAHLQATGLVNDHLVSCPRRQEIIRSCRRFRVE